MSNRLTRAYTQKTATIAASTATSDEVIYGPYNSMMLDMPATWTAASIGFYVSPTSGGTYQVAYDDDGNLLQVDSPAVNCSYSVPIGLAGAGYMKLWSQNGSASHTTQAASRSIIVSMKS